MDFVGPINPPGKGNSVQYIITMTDYLTRWAKATPVVDYTIVIAARLLFDNIVTWFGCPRILMSDQGIHFFNRTIGTLTEDL